jgi:hypothetical protein
MADQFSVGVEFVDADGLAKSVASARGQVLVFFLPKTS